MEQLYGKASRIWVFDRGVASERNLEALRAQGGLYLVGTPRTLLRKVEAQLARGELRRRSARASRSSVVAAPDGSAGHLHPLPLRPDGSEKEAAIHDRFEQKDGGAARATQQAAISVGTPREPRRAPAAPRTPQARVLARGPRLHASASTGDGRSPAASPGPRTSRRPQCMRQTEGAYLLRTNLTGHDEPSSGTCTCSSTTPRPPSARSSRISRSAPSTTSTKHRVKAHVLVCFLAYALYRTLDRLAKNKGLAMSPRRVLDTLANIKRGDIILPLVDGRELRLRRVSRPDPSRPRSSPGSVSTCPSASAPTPSTCPV